MRVFRILMVILILACAAPLVSMGVAQVIADYNGCKLTLASVEPCIVSGVDIGGTLTTMGFMGYFLFFTLPILIGLVGLWIIVEIVRWSSRRSAAPAK